MPILTGLKTVSANCLMVAGAFEMKLSDEKIPAAEKNTQNRIEGSTMASSKEYLEYVLMQLSELEGITYRAMMGEYIIYYRGKIVGGIYDDRLLIKPMKAALSYLSTAVYESPYEGAREMLLVDEIDNKRYLAGLFNAVYEELPAPKTKGAS